MIIETPRYVRDGVQRIDDLIVDRIYNREGDYGSSATSNTGQVHELPGAPFTMRAFSWADCIHQDEEPYEGFNFPGYPYNYCQDEACHACAPQFSHPASGLKLWWYKHLNRIPECNRQISYEEWRDIQRECEDWVIENENH